MVKVVQIQYSTKSAGSSAQRLHHAFIQANIESRLISLQADISSLDGITYLGDIAKIKARIDSRIQSYLTRHTIKKFGLFSFPVLGTNISKIQEVEKADIIYIHWVLMGFLNINGLKDLARLNKPVVIVMHDMWPFTGGCHYSFSCDKYKTMCSDCQMFTSKNKIDLAAIEFKKKAKMYTKFSNFYFISPSRWLYNCANNSMLIKDKHLLYIPNIIDNKLFKPFDKNTAKAILNIESSETIIAFGAVSIDSPYKGRIFLQQALEIFKQRNEIENVSILIFGSEYNQLIADEMPFKTYFIGRLHDDYSISVVYNASDVFVVPSLADNQPTTVMESMCCGTPVVGFDVGGIPDMIVHKKNGYLAKYKDAEDLANGIIYCIKNKIKGEMLTVFDKNGIVKKHIDLINTIKSYHE